MPKEKVKVLLIEDDETARNLLKRVIDKEGYETLVASDGYEGVNLFRSEKPDIVITDMQMPRINGMEVMHTIKDISPSTEVILITAYADYDTAILALQQGALDYLRKPVDLDQLILSLGRAMEKIIERRKINIDPSLLILDDDKNTRDRLARTFEKEGYEVFTGANGEEGIELFSQNKIDILLVDIKMPKKDGIEVLHEAKKVSKDCEVIMMTGYGDENSAIQAMRNGAINYIRKPIDLDQLGLAVRKAADKQRLQRAYLYKARALELAQQIIAKITRGKELVVELQDGSRAEARNFASSLINTAPIPFVLIDRDMNVDFVSGYFVRLYGYAPKRIEDDFIQKLGLKHVGIERVRHGIRKAYKSEESKIVSIPIGEQKQILVIKVSLITDRGTKERVLAIIGGGR
ncbi:response regulator [bacterium]|nr:MAG: response regulator [bacterium]